MDLGTVRQKLTAGEYSAPGEFKSDIELIFDNAKFYNARGSEVSESLYYYRGIFLAHRSHNLLYLVKLYYMYMYYVSLHPLVYIFRTKLKLQVYILLCASHRYKMYIIPFLIDLIKLELLLVYFGISCLNLVHF